MSQLDALHLELLHAAIPQQYDTIGVRMPALPDESAVVLQAYRSAAKRLCRSGAGNVDSVFAAFLSDAQCRRTQGRGYVQEVLWTVMLAASQTEGIPFAKRLEWLDKLAQCIDNWASCDLLGEAAKVSRFRKMKRQRLPFWMRSSSREISGAYVLRWCLCSRTAPAGSRPLERACSVVLSPRSADRAAQSYYGSMGLAWAFSVYAVHDFSLVERVVTDLIVNKRIDPATARRTAQKVRESFRSAQAEKALLSQNIQKALDGIPGRQLACRPEQQARWRRTGLSKEAPQRHASQCRSITYRIG